jgi:hypothetical protein
VTNQVYQNSQKYWVQPQAQQPNTVYLSCPQIPQYIVQQPNNNKQVKQINRFSRSKSSTRTNERSQSRPRTASVNFNINTTKSTDNNASHSIGPEQDGLKYLRWRKTIHHNGRPTTAARFSFALPMANRIDQCLVRSKLDDDIFALTFNLQHSAFFNDVLWSKSEHKPNSDDSAHLLYIVRTACDVYINRLSQLLSDNPADNTIHSVLTIGKS